MVVISIENMHKVFKLYDTQLDRLKDWVYPRGIKKYKEFHVLKNINLNVSSGESIGIIGVNGAGKSTFLKLITNTMRPTSGKIIVNGKISALLELGMGFHPDFTGRQNIYMSGQLLGYKLSEIEEVLPDIEKFAEIGEFIDKPIRVYSSGMIVRLAFSVATAIRPSILIVDEALAVGDIAFQRKCFSRIEEYKKLGTTLLFVSHDLEMIKKLCDKAIFLNNGEIELFATPKVVCEAYEKKIFSKQPISKKVKKKSFSPDIAGLKIGQSYGDEKAKIYNVNVLNGSENNANIFYYGELIKIKFEVYFDSKVENPIFGLMFKTKEGVCIYYIDSKILDENYGVYYEGDKISLTLKLRNNLVPNKYFINISVRSEYSGEEYVHHRLVDGVVIAVEPAISGRYPGGSANLDCVIDIEK